jgi:hypothetical protein
MTHDAATGAQLWTANAGGAISPGNGNVISARAGGGGFARGADWQHVVSLHAFDEPVTVGKW